MKRATFGLYKYFGMESAFKEIDVYIDLDKKHPDPSKLMLWGKDREGNTVSDFKRSFERSGETVSLNYAEAGTAHLTQINKVNALNSYLATINK